MTHGDMEENVSGCFFSEHSVNFTNSVTQYQYNLANTTDCYVPKWPCLLAASNYYWKYFDRVLHT